MIRPHLRPFALLAAFAAFAASAPSGCGPSSPPGTEADMAALPTPDLSMAGCVPPVNGPSCQDQSIQQLPLFKLKPSTRPVTNTKDGDGWISGVDATGGGFTPTESFLYLKFTDAGLTKVAVHDEAAFTSTEWDIAFRRFIARLNSGVSGPGCVTGANSGETDFDAVKAVPGGLTLEKEAYFDAMCKLVEDMSGLGSPATVLKDYWSYDMCVKTTGNVYVIRLADGKHVKLAVTDYYDPATQKTCNETGTVPMGSVGAKLKVRWAFLGN